MSPSSTPSPDHISQFFATPDCCEEDLSKLLEEHEPGELRRKILDYVVTADLDDEHQFLICATLDSLGVGDEENRLLGLLGSESLDIRVRVLAFELLLHEGTFEDSRAARTIDRETLLQFHEFRLRILLRSIFRDPSLSGILVSLHEGCLDEELVLASFMKVESLRREERVPACVAYRGLIAEAGNGNLRELAIDAIHSEGGVVGRSTLEALRCANIPRLGRRQIHRILAHWDSTTALDPKARDVKAEMSWVDHRGDIMAIFTWPRANGRFDSFALLLNTQEGLLMARAALDVVEDRCLASQLNLEFGARQSVAEFNPMVAAGVVLASRKLRLARGRNCLDLAEPIVARLETLCAPTNQNFECLAKALDAHEGRNLMQTSPYSSWDCLVLNRAKEDELVQRLQFMALWHRQKGETRCAEVAESLARSPNLARLALGTDRDESSAQPA